MTKIEEIEDAVQALSREEFMQLFDWMSNKNNDIWDRQFEDDVLSGKLEKFKQQAMSDFTNGKCTLL